MGQPSPFSGCHPGVSMGHHVRQVHAEPSICGRGLRRLSLRPAWRPGQVHSDIYRRPRLPRPPPFAQAPTQLCCRWGTVDPFPEPHPAPPFPCPLPRQSTDLLAVHLIVAFHLAGGTAHPASHPTSGVLFSGRGAFPQGGGSGQADTFSSPLLRAPNPRGRKLLARMCFVASKVQRWWTGQK